MRWHKAAAWAAGGAALLLVAGAMALQAFVDPERLAQLAREKVRAAWGRELRVEHLRLRLFPLPHLGADRVSLANPSWAEDPHLLQADEVNADLELLPLLVGQVRIRTLSLRGVRASLEEGDDGAVSWELRGNEVPAAESGDAVQPVQIAELQLRDVAVQHLARRQRGEPLRIEDARLLLDPGPGLRNVRLEAKVSRHGQPLGIKARFADLSGLGVARATSEGTVELAWRETRAKVAGRFPLHRELAGASLEGEMKSASLQDVLAFMGFERGRTAPFSLQLAAAQDGGKLVVKRLAARLGELALRGDAAVTFAAGKNPVFAAKLQAERLDWLETLVDAGGTVEPPRNDGEVFHRDPVAWRAFSVLGRLQGSADLDVRSLRLGNGVELSNVRAKAAFGDERVELAPFTAEMLGGKAGGSIRIDASKKSIQARLSGENLLLERWFEERGRKVPFSGGPIKLDAAVALSGDTFRDLAASVTGPVAIRMGRGKLESARAGEIEEMMVSALAPQDTGSIEFECASAKLDFRRGRAEGERIVGARSTASQLLTSGYIDYRDETLDLRGRVDARKGASIGLAALAGGVQITGKVAKPKVGMDPDDKPAILARAAAAIATSGATLVGEALLKAASKEDPCEAVFR